MPPSSPPAAGNNVRQQLDELDALLQRMLALPINQLDDEAGASEPPPRHFVESQPLSAPAAPTAPAQAANGWRPPAMVLLADSGPVKAPETPPETWDQGWGINLNPQQGSSVLGPRSPAAGAMRTQVPEPSPMPPPVWRAETVTYTRPAAPTSIPFRPSVPSPPATASIQAPISAPAEPAPRPRLAVRPPPPPPIPFLMQPLAWLTYAFDGFVVHFGPPGRWLRSPHGRVALGGSGLLMLAGGVAWGVLDWIGWTW